MKINRKCRKSHVLIHSLKNQSIVPGSQQENKDKVSPKLLKKVIKQLFQCEKIECPRKAYNIQLISKGKETGFMRKKLEFLPYLSKI